jgi:hypothetical protein
MALTLPVQSGNVSNGKHSPMRFFAAGLRVASRPVLTYQTKRVWTFAVAAVGLQLEKDPFVAGTLGATVSV